MSKVIEQFGTRPDGVKIHFTDKEISQVDRPILEEFTSITRKEVMSKGEFVNRYLI